MECSNYFGGLKGILLVPIIKEKEYMSDKISRYYQLKKLLEVYPTMNKEGAKELLAKINPLSDEIEIFERISHINQKNPEQFSIKTKVGLKSIVTVHNSKKIKYQNYVSEKVKMQFELLYRKQKNINLKTK